MQLKNLNNHYKMLIDNSVITTRDLQTNTMFQEKVKEILYEYLPQYKELPE